MSYLKKIQFACLLLCPFVTYAQEVILPQKPEREIYKDYEELSTGFWCSLEGSTGSSIIFNEKNLQFGSFIVTGGFRFSEYLRIGVGTGGRFYYNNNNPLRMSKNKWAMPVLINARGNLISQNSRLLVPYWSLNLGTVIRDGVFVQPTIGYRLGQHRDSWLIGISYYLSHLKVASTRNSTINMISINIGYEF